jgi:hypothetical protein
MNIYLTHCSAKKDPRVRVSAQKVGPDTLYTATPTQRFMKRCKAVGVTWAIFSDEYGVWFPHTEHKWYEKHPATVTELEFQALLQNFDASLARFERIFFYHNPGRFHPLYDRLLRETSLADRVQRITHLTDIA